MRRLTIPRLSVRRFRRRLSDPERGSAAIIAILMSTGVLLGMVALTVDVGRVFVERRQLQSGADSAALAVAEDAARACTAAACPPVSRAQTYANLNANDGASGVLEVCGAGWVALTACSTQTTPDLTRCPAPPTGATQWVRVRTRTASTTGTTLLPSTFARVLAGGGVAGTTVFACAQVAWGTPSSLTPSVPMAISMCDWNAATSNGTNFAPPPPYAPAPATYPASTYERFLTLHAVNDTSGGCGSVPGGFGWLDAGSSCQTTVSSGWVSVDTGVSGSTCGDRIRDAVGTAVYVPVFAEARGSGSSGQYRIDGFAAFFITGYWLPGVQPNHKDSIATNRALCHGQDKCIYGYFTQGLVPTGGTLGGGATARGASVVQLIG
jgi:Flp pilus assembly protein TadG